MGVILGIAVLAVLLLLPGILILKTEDVAGSRKALWAAFAFLGPLVLVTILGLIQALLMKLLPVSFESTLSMISMLNLVWLIGPWAVLIFFKKRIEKEQAARPPEPPGFRDYRSR